MFVRSIRMNTIKLVGIAALAVLAIVVLFIFIPSRSSSHAPDASETIRFDKMKTDDDRVSFLSEYGYTVDSTPTESVEVTIPDEFDKVFAAYNELQKAIGLDLGRYKGKKAMRYTYNVTNYDGYKDKVYANLIVYKNKIIGGDICSADPNGFAHGLKK